MRKRRKISFLGDLVIILIIVLFVFLFLRQLKQNNINEIAKINEEFGLSETVLVPGDKNQYVLKLSAVNDKEITPVLTEFIKLNQDVESVERLIFRASVVREECISRDLKFKINSINFKIDKQISDFENLKGYDKLNIESYLSFLRNLKVEYLSYRLEAERIPVC